jgi:hypothetical protein
MSRRQKTDMAAIGLSLLALGYMIVTSLAHNL